MRIPLEWLKEFVNLTASPEEIADRLTMIGLEVEGTERMDGDVIFEVNVTPNRADCLSVIGIARELSAIYRRPLNFPDHVFAAETGDLDFNVDILDPDLCHRYAGRIVRRLTIGQSPEWLQRRLEKCGIRSINNVVDVTNYVLLELGHPLHAFDLRTIRGHLIRVGTPRTVLGREGLTFTTLDGNERHIPGDSLLIWDAEVPVAIAGVMGGLDTEVTDSTTEIFIESAYFDPLSIRRTSKALGLKTESSYRFERGSDIKMLKKSLDRAALLVGKVAGGSIYGKVDIYPRRHYPSDIIVRYEKVNRILGLALTADEVLGCLRALDLEIEEHADHLKVKPPAYRGDLRKEWDIIEEVARIHGYDRIPAELPRTSLGVVEREAGIKRHVRQVKADMKQSLLKSGFTETINYSFMGPQDLDLLAFGENDPRRGTVEIRNPLRGEDSCMRTTLLPSLLRNVVHNVARGNRELRLFELSRVFISETPGALPSEKEHAAVLSYREKAKSLYRDDVHDFYVIKGVVEAILKDLKIQDYAFIRSTEPYLHPGQSADLLVGGEKAGYCGVLSPMVIDTLDLKAQRPSLVVLELSIEKLIPQTLQAIKYAPLPKYPSVERDTAIVVDASLESSAIINWVKSFDSGFIEESSLFDVYQGGAIPKGKKSIAFTVRYRAADKTLTDEEVDTIHRALVEHILGKSQGQLRQ